MRYVILYLVMFIGAYAYALDIPYTSSADGRIQYVEYNPSDVVQINASVAIGTQIVFAIDEEILDIASGFNPGWDFANRGNVLFLKVKSVKSNQELIMPSPDEWNTNLLVTTNKHLYAFDLKVVDRDSQDFGEVVAYRVQFKYTKDEMLARHNKLKEERVKQREKQFAKETELRMKKNRYSAVNWNYTMQVGKNSRNIAPNMMYDDGRFTYIKFPQTNEFPVAFLVDDDKSESIINSHVENDILVLHTVAKEFVLRSGNKVVGIYNEQHGFQLINKSQTGTNVPGVQRVIKPAL